MVMRFEIAVHAQRGRMRSDLSQQPTLDEKPQIVVDRGERNGWNATSDRGVNVFWRMVSVGSDDGLIDHLTLVRDRQTVLRGQLTELFMGEVHDYRMRISIKRPRAVSIEIFPVTSKRAGGRKTCIGNTIEVARLSTASRSNNTQIRGNPMEPHTSVVGVTRFEPFIGLKEAAELLQMHPDTIKKKTRKGEIPGRKLGRRWKYRVSELDAYAKSAAISRYPNHAA